jgi:hypothetical protein
MDAKAPSPAVMERRATPKKAKEPKVKTYTVDPKLAGGTTATGIGSSLSALDEAHVLDGLDAVCFDRLCHSIAALRALSQGLSPATFTSSECAHLRVALQALKPSDIGRAMWWAGRDPFWSTQTLNFRVLTEHGPTWLMKATTGKVDKRDRVTVLRGEVASHLGTLCAMSPMRAADLDVDTARWDAAQLEAHLAIIRKEIAQRSRST